MRVQLACDGDVAITVEALHEFFALIPEIGLRGEVGCRAFAIRERGRRCGWREGCGSVELRVGVFRCRVIGERLRRIRLRGGWGCRVSMATGWPGCARSLVTLVVDRPVLIRCHWGMLGAIDGLLSGWIWSISAES